MTYITSRLSPRYRENGTHTHITAVANNVRGSALPITGRIISTDGGLTNYTRLTVQTQRAGNIRIESFTNSISRLEIYHTDDLEAS